MSCFVVYDENVLPLYNEFASEACNDMPWCELQSNTRTINMSVCEMSKILVQKTYITNTKFILTLNIPGFHWFKTEKCLLLSRHKYWMYTYMINSKDPENYVISKKLLNSLTPTTKEFDMMQHLRSNRKEVYEKASNGSVVAFGETIVFMQKDYQKHYGNINIILWINAKYPNPQISNAVKSVNIGKVLQGISKIPADSGVDVRTIKSLYIQIGPDESISFNFAQCQVFERCYDLETITINPLSGSKSFRKFSFSKSTQPNDFYKVFRTSVVLHCQSDCEYTYFPCVLPYVVLPPELQPKKTSNGLIDCSVQHYGRFEGLFRCNMRKECEVGEDENNCSYLSSDCGPDRIDVGQKCWQIFNDIKYWPEAKVACEQKGQRLATFAAKGELQLLHLALNVKTKPTDEDVYVGIKSMKSFIKLPPYAKWLYRRFVFWEDDTVAYNFNHIYNYPILYNSWTNYMTPCYSLRFRSVFTLSCFTTFKDYLYVCEEDKTENDNTTNTKNKNIVTSSKQLIDQNINTLDKFTSTTNISRSKTKDNLMITCSEQFLAKDFLACEKEYVCFSEKNRNKRYCKIHDKRQKDTTKRQVGKTNNLKDNRNDRIENLLENKQKSKTLSSISKHNRKSTSDFLQNTVNSVHMFECKSANKFIHYTLVCNHIQNCPANSDENFCIYESCPYPDYFKCTSGECIPFSQTLDGVNDCHDMNDEMLGVSTERFHVPSALPPSKVTFDGMGLFSAENLDDETGEFGLYDDNVVGSRTIGLQRKTQNGRVGSETNSDIKHGVHLQTEVQCPSTHFACSEGLCLPVYVICNGVKDCQGGVDELDCASYECPGYYR